MPVSLWQHLDAWWTFLLFIHEPNGLTTMRKPGNSVNATLLHHPY